MGDIRIHVCTINENPKITGVITRQVQIVAVGQSQKQGYSTPYIKEAIRLDPRTPPTFLSNAAFKSVTLLR